MQTIDTYKLTSMDEPSDEILSQIMHEAAIDVKKKGDEAHKRYFSNLRKYATAQRRLWSKGHRAFLLAK